MFTRLFALGAFAILLAAPLEGLAQGTPGTSSKVTIGTVDRAEPTRLDSKAPSGALIGGALGLAAGSGKSSGKKARNAIIGAAAGSAIAGRAQGGRRGTIYTVSTGAGSSIRIVSDQTGIIAGDCVAVEESGSTANIRRLAPTACDAASQGAVTSLESEFQREAGACAVAKDELVNATTAEAADLAARKVGILCND